MKFSTKTTYGLKALIYLAKNQGQLTSASIIAKAENISPKYLERLFSQLKKSKLIDSEIGSLGGYRLSREPKKINVYEILQSLDEEKSSFYCLSGDAKVYCAAKCHCPAISGLKKIENTIIKALESLKLSDLIK